MVPPATSGGQAGNHGEGGAVDEQRDKIKDLEVKEDEARDIAGGKEANSIRWGAKSRGKKSVDAMKVKRNQT